MKDLVSFVHFRGGKIVNSTNDGMELLGHFLLSQVGAQTDFFKKWLEDPREHAISSGPYFVYTKDDMVYLEHLENSKIVSFYTDHKSFLNIIERWESFCADDSYAVCSLQGSHTLILSRSPDGQEFTFETVKV